MASLRRLAGGFCTILLLFRAIHINGKSFKRLKVTHSGALTNNTEVDILQLLTSTDRPLEEEIEKVLSSVVHDEQRGDFPQGALTGLHHSRSSQLSLKTTLGRVEKRLVPFLFQQHQVTLTSHSRIGPIQFYLLGLPTSMVTCDVFLTESTPRWSPCSPSSVVTLSFHCATSVAPCQARVPF